MLKLWGSLAGLLLYLELIYHFSGFGFHLSNPLFTIFLLLTWSSVETLIVGCLKGRAKMAAYQFFIWWSIVWTGAQMVYLHIFKQPMLWEMIFGGAKDALTNYWREALQGFFEVLPFAMLLLLPGVLLCFLLAKKKWRLPQFGNLQVMRMAVVFVAGLSACVIDLEVGRAIRADYYEDYSEFFDPLTVIEKMGVHTALQRDTTLWVQRLAKSAAASIHKGGAGIRQPNPTPGDPAVAEPGGQTPGIPAATASPGPDDDRRPGESAGSDPAGESTPLKTPRPIQPHAFSLDFEKLKAEAENKRQTWLAEYLEGLSPTMSNEYTGLFEGYNLIFLTAEGFSPYAVREDLTPTLYHMIHSGFVFENYYVPLWQTSTSDGEYVNCSGLIPDGQFSMKKSAANAMPYTMAGFFNRAGVQSRAYHNNNLSYYDRYLTHPNLGYLYKSCNLGGLDAETYGKYLFEMEGAGLWPASDYEMMVATMPEYIRSERFHVYYMTVSGHMYYTFRGNSMSGKNREAVQDLDLSENGQAYLACHIELDRALEYLLEQLREAGKLEKTVIVMSADHYPYAMTTEQYEELAGKSLSEGKELFRNNLILWNAAFEDEPLVVKKACCSMDLVPTLLNLFGFPYDSRMYAGRDIFSEEEGLVIFNDKSFVTDALIYNRKNKEAIWLKDEYGRDLVPESGREAYLEEKQQEVRERYQFSAYILEENYYQKIEGAIVR